MPEEIEDYIDLIAVFIAMDRISDSTGDTISLDIFSCPPSPPDGAKFTTLLFDRVKSGQLQVACSKAFHIRRRFIPREGGGNSLECDRGGKCAPTIPSIGVFFCLFVLISGGRVS